MTSQDTTEAAGGELDAAGLEAAHREFTSYWNGIDRPLPEIIEFTIRAYLRATPPSPDAGLVEANLKLIKERVCGDAYPRWGNDIETTGSRLAIADLADAALAALARPAAEPVAGWKMVPIKPTVEMLKAAADEKARVRRDHDDEAIGSDYYQAMVAASPVQPQAERADLVEALKNAAGALESLSYIHDGNPSDAMADTPPLDYARRMLFEARQMAKAAHSEARTALKEQGDE